MAENPFAESFSSQATAGVTGIQRRAIGALDGVGQSVAGFNAESNSLNSPIPGSTTVRSLGEPNRSGGSASAANPFDDGSTSGATGAPFYDLTKNQFVEVPANHVLFRSVSTGPIQVVRNDTVRARQGDRPELGVAGCSRDGVGLVTAPCEARRRGRRTRLAIEATQRRTALNRRSLAGGNSSTASRSA